MYRIARVYQSTSPCWRVHQFLVDKILSSIVATILDQANLTYIFLKQQLKTINQYPKLFIRNNDTTPCSLIQEYKSYVARTKSKSRGKNRHGPHTATKSQISVSCIQIIHSTQLSYRQMFPFYRTSAIKVQSRKILMIVSRILVFGALPFGLRRIACC